MSPFDGNPTGDGRASRKREVLEARQRVATEHGYAGQVATFAMTRRETPLAVPVAMILRCCWPWPATVTFVPADISYLKLVAPSAARVRPSLRICCVTVGHQPVPRIGSSKS